MKMKSKEKKAYKDFQDRVAMLGKPRKLTEEEIKKLKKKDVFSTTSQKWPVVFLYSFLKLRRHNRGR